MIPDWVREGGVGRSGALWPHCGWGLINDLNCHHWIAYSPIIKMHLLYGDDYENHELKVYINMFKVHLHLHVLNLLRS